MKLIHTVIIIISSTFFINTYAQDAAMTSSSNSTEATSTNASETNVNTITNGDSDIVAPIKTGSPTSTITMAPKQIEAQWLSAKIKFDYSDAGQTLSANGNIRLCKDSVIWMNVKKIGIEVARTLITKDSIFILNQLTSEYIATDLQFLKRKFNLPADLETLQALVLGNAVYPAGIPILAQQDDSYQLFIADSTNLSATYAIDLLSSLMLQLNIEEKSSNRALEATYNNFQTLSDGQQMSIERNYALKGASVGTVELAIALSDVEINVPKTIRFDIPEHFKRLDIEPLRP